MLGSVTNVMCYMEPICSMLSNHELKNRTHISVSHCGEVYKHIKSPIGKMKSSETDWQNVAELPLNPKAMLIFRWLQTQITCSLPYSCSHRSRSLGMHRYLGKHFCLPGPAVHPFSYWLYNREGATACVSYTCLCCWVWGSSAVPVQDRSCRG